MCLPVTLVGIHQPLGLHMRIDELLGGRNRLIVGVGGVHEEAVALDHRVEGPIVAVVRLLGQESGRGR